MASHDRRTDRAIAYARQLAEGEASSAQQWQKQKQKPRHDAVQLREELVVAPVVAADREKQAACAAARKALAELKAAGVSPRPVPAVLRSRSRAA